ncbi:phytanoyl-CoA dioxygenase family protein [Microbulbifer variabilis]|uniref:Phytanoyl-CoA dioxygenase family protein n=1 Tax=Microbulbifer variabilis TaxID=266805 RepID=A0ABY4VFJ9_9GAMM|nr:phytanoyl-CoA dioxygenase family protein [Microbulbifer variabilis]USD23080.1 phytanoyl-CoA dioxygenase family protein [Microbulbifer variabilis]
MIDLEKGYSLINDIFPEGQLEVLQNEFEDLKLARGTGGIRNVEKKHSSIAALATSDLIVNLAQRYLIQRPRLVRSILFDKNEKCNWFVTWHQDKTVAVSSKFTKSGWGPWSVKDGFHHVQPPLHVLKQMITIRIHLDDTDANNGCLKLIPGSQQHGILKKEEIYQYVKEHDPVACEAKSGSALIMYPHILHASDRALFPRRRRVIHLEYSCYELLAGVTWA